MAAMKSLLVINNFYGTEAAFTLPDSLAPDEWKAEVLLTNDEAREGLQNMTLRPYESIVYRLTKPC